MDWLDRNGLTEREFLEQYRAGDYERPSVAADMVIFTVTDEEADSYRKLPEKSSASCSSAGRGHPSWVNGRCLAALSSRTRRLSRPR